MFYFNGNHSQTTPKTQEQFATKYLTNIFFVLNYNQQQRRNTTKRIRSSRMPRQRETKKQKALRKDNANKKVEIDTKDLRSLAETLAALSNFDASKARKFIMSPKTIMDFITGQHNIACPYLLHAILMALANENHYQILNEMSDSDIEILKQCVDFVTKRKFSIDPTIINAQIETRKNKQLTLSVNQLLDNELVITSLMISRKVISSWSDADRVLKQWADAIETFTKVKTNTHTQTNPTHVAETKSNEPGDLLNYKQLAKQLGNVKEINVYNHITRQIFGARSRLLHEKNQNNISEIRNWFVKIKRGCYVTYMLHAEHFDEYKQLFEQRTTRTKKHPVDDSKHLTQLDIKSAETSLAALVKLYDQAAQDLDTLVQKRQFIQQSIATETDEDKIDEMSIMLKDINDKVKNKRSLVEKFEKVKILNDKQKQAQTEKAAAENALRVATDSLNSINAEISEFLSTSQQNFK